MRRVAALSCVRSSLQRKRATAMIPSKWGILLVTAATATPPSQAAFCSAATSLSHGPCINRLRSHRWHARLQSTSSTSSSIVSDEDVEEATLAWVRRVVVGWNLCPFADRPLREGKLHLNTVRGTDQDTILGVVLGEMLVRKDVPGTTLVVAPECFPEDFEKYLSFVTTLEEDLMDEYELHGEVQVAPFHPLFEFAGSGKDGIDNYTNRSPYPMFHILREAEVASAVDKLGGDAGKVWKRNVDLLEDLQETLGTDGVKDAISGNAQLKEKVDEVLKRHRFKVGENSI